MRFGCCASLDQIQIVQDAGYDYIELPVSSVKAESPDSEFEGVLEFVRSFDIVPEAWYELLPLDIKVTGPEVDDYRIERYLRTALERVEELGGEIVVFGCGSSRNVPDGFSHDEAKEQIVEFITLAGRIAGAHGITIALEPLNRNESNIINTVSDGLEIVRKVDHPFVKLLVDLYHMQEEAESFERIIEARTEIVHVHTADAGKYYPGSGNYPQTALFEVLKEIGYNERISVECKWQDFASEAPKAISYLRKLSSEIFY